CTCLLRTRHPNSRGSSAHKSCAREHVERVGAAPNQVNSDLNRPIFCTQLARKKLLACALSARFAIDSLAGEISWSLPAEAKKEAVQLWPCFSRAGWRANPLTPCHPRIRANAVRTLAPVVARQRDTQLNTSAGLPAFLSSGIATPPAGHALGQYSDRSNQSRIEVST